MFIILILFSFLEIALASTLKIGSLPNWELKKNFIGQDYVLVEGREGKNSLLIKKIPLEIKDQKMEEILMEMIEAKKSSKVSWKNIRIKEKKKLSWDKKKSGVLMLVEHEKNEKLFSTILGGYPVDGSYYFVFFSESSSTFEKKRDVIVRLIQEIKIK